MTERSKTNGRRKSQSLRQSSRGMNRLEEKTRTHRLNQKAQLLGRYIVADPRICHGKPTFRGTRIMVWQVLEMVAEGMAWESIVEEWDGSIRREAIAEAVRLASASFLKHAHEYALEPLAA